MLFFPGTNPLGPEDLNVYSLSEFFLQKTSMAAIINDIRVGKSTTNAQNVPKSQKKITPKSFLLKKFAIKIILWYN